MAYKIFHFTKEGEFFKNLDTLKRQPNVPIKTMLFIYDFRYKLLDILNKIKPYDYEKSSYKIELEDEETLLLDLDIRKDSEKLSESNGKVFLLVYKKQPLCIMITNSDRKYFNNVLNFFNKYYPLLSRIFLRSYEIKDLLTKVEHLDKIQLAVKNYVVKRYYIKPKTEIAYEKISFDDVFKRASENFLWVDSISLDILKNSTSGNIRINRRGLISYIGLDFSSVFSLFISKILDNYARLYSEILSERSRSLEKLEPRPLRFAIEEEIFRSSKDLEQFLQSLHKNLYNWGYSVLFKEGSYIFLLLHDYQTGSSYEILISSSSEIFVIPQTQVTSISFSTLLNFLVNTYDGVIEDVKQ